MNADSIYRYNEDDVCAQLFGTNDEAHPGVRAIQAKGPFFVGARSKRFPMLFPGIGIVILFRKRPAYYSKDETGIQSSVFKSGMFPIVPTNICRNLPSNTSMACSSSPRSEKKSGDYTNDATLQGYESLINRYYPTESTALSMFKSRMWYAGPREALFDSIVRKNFGCTHFIIGRDHASVGDYYDDFESQELLETVDDIGIEPIYYHYAFYCEICDEIVSEKICPHDNDYHLEPSGTKLRETLSAGQRPAEELMRPEVAESVLALG